jgi:hypothetical protein
MSVASNQQEAGSKHMLTETSVDFYRTTRRHIPENSSLVCSEEKCLLPLTNAPLAPTSAVSGDRITQRSRTHLYLDQEGFVCLGSKMGPTAEGMRSAGVTLSLIQCSVSCHRTDWSHGDALNLHLGCARFESAPHPQSVEFNAYPHTLFH